MLLCALTEDIRDPHFRTEDPVCCLSARGKNPGLRVQRPPGLAPPSSVTLANKATSPLWDSVVTAKDWIPGPQGLRQLSKYMSLYVFILQHGAYKKYKLTFYPQVWETRPSQLCSFLPLPPVEGKTEQKELSWKAKIKVRLVTGKNILTRIHSPLRYSVSPFFFQLILFGSKNKT